MRHLLPCPPCGRQGRPGGGFLAGSNTKEPRGSAPRERDHRGGDHPVPSRTRQLSPPSPRVLQRKAAGGQGVALAEGAFLSAPRGARGGMLPPAGPFCVMGCRPPYPASSEVAPFRLAVIAAAMRRARRRAAEGAPPRLFSSQRVAKSIRWCWQRSAAVGPAVGISRPAGPFCAMKFRGVCRMLCLFYLRLF